MSLGMKYVLSKKKVIVIIVLLIIVLSSTYSFNNSSGLEKKNHNHNTFNSLPVHVQNAAVNPFDYTKEPAPMGIADFGIGPHGVPYEYNTSAFMGTIKITKFLAYNASLGVYGDNNITFQLNTIYSFVDSSTLYNYWIQDVYAFNTSTHSITVEDNVWNWSNPVDQNLTSSTLSGNGTICLGSAPSGNVYIDAPVASSALPGLGSTISYPSTLKLMVNSSSTTAGLPEVAFKYNIGNGWVTYDNVIFKFAKNVNANYGFVVNGNVSTLNGYYYETDLILGGPGGGTGNIVKTARMNMSLKYWNGHNYQSVQNAYDFSGNTGETIANVTASMYVNKTSGLVCSSLNNSGSLSSETDYATQVIFQNDNLSSINIENQLGGGKLIVDSITYNFTGNDVNITLNPGSYNVNLETSSGTSELSGTYTLSKGEILHLSVSTYLASFYENGLPSNTQWGVTINSVTYASYKNNITIPLADGTYSYSLNKVYAYTPSAGSSSFTINGVNIAQHVYFFQNISLIAGATASDSNLGVYSTAYKADCIAFTPGPSTVLANKVSLLVTGDGSFSISIGTTTRGTQILAETASRTVSFANGYGWENFTFSTVYLYGGGFYYINVFLSSTSTGGTNPLQVMTNLSNKPLITYQNSLSGFIYSGSASYYPGYLVQFMFQISYFSYKVTFAESVLPSSTQWFVNITNESSSKECSFDSFSTSFSIYLINGTYSYNIATTDKIYHANGGSFTVTGSPLPVSITFSYFTYSVTFTESGLPSSTIWYVNITGQSSLSSITTTITANLVNGTYSYNIATTDKIYHANGGSFPVDGSTVTEAITFSYFTYSVTFTESGLPSSTIWYVNITGEASSGQLNSGSPFCIKLINGTYSYNIATTDKIYHANGGSFTESAGSPSSEAITFNLYKYSVTFTESGLPSSTIWYVNITGEASSGQLNSGSPFCIKLINGTYSYNIATTDKIYHANAGSFTVTGSPLPVSITFSYFTY
ncbi:MAG: thermopsin, partial [Thermoplasmataceae archaeon]